MTNKITHAPQEVIDVLNSIQEASTPWWVLDTIANAFGRFEPVQSWVYDKTRHEYTSAQLAIINHVFGDEKLKPEREPRWYVEFMEGFYIALNPQDQPDIFARVPAYTVGMTEKQAKGYAELFGGEAKEIK